MPGSSSKTRPAVNQIRLWDTSSPTILDTSGRETLPALSCWTSPVLGHVQPQDFSGTKTFSSLRFFLTVQRTSENFSKLHQFLRISRTFQSFGMEMFQGWECLRARLVSRFGAGDVQGKKCLVARSVLELMSNMTYIVLVGDTLQSH